jgi:SAM-dependent methyltransferase
MRSTDPLIGSPLQTVPCDYCGESKDQTLLTLPDLISNTSDHVFRIAKCRGCDLIYLNPRPYEWDLPTYYPEHYAPFSRSKPGNLARSWLHSRSVSELSSFLSSPKRIVDVGCGTGELLEIVRNAGNSRIEGVEPSPEAVRIARETRNIPIHPGTLEQARFDSASIDTVLMSHVLEHLPSPSKTLREVARILKPGGAVIIWVPNANSFAARILGRYWMGWDVPRHLYSFTPGSLHKLLTAAELLPGKILHERHAIEWAWGLRLWTRARAGNDRLDSILAAIYPLLAVGLSPIGLLAAASGKAGRIRIIAHKPIS